MRVGSRKSRVALQILAGVAVPSVLLALVMQDVVNVLAVVAVITGSAVFAVVVMALAGWFRGKPVDSTSPVAVQILANGYTASALCAAGVGTIVASLLAGQTGVLLFFVGIGLMGGMFGCLHLFWQKQHSDSSSNSRRTEPHYGMCWISSIVLVNVCFSASPLEIADRAGITAEAAPWQPFADEALRILRGTAQQLAALREVADDTKVLVRRVDDRTATMSAVLQQIAGIDLPKYDPSVFTDQENEWIEQAKADPDPMLRFLAAVLTHDIELALDMEREVLHDQWNQSRRGEPEDPETLFYFRRTQGDLRGQLDDHDAAIGFYRQALELDADDPSTLNSLAFALIDAPAGTDHRDAFAESEALLGRAWELLHEHDPARPEHLVTAGTNLAMVKTIRGKLREAIELHEEVRDLVAGYSIEEKRANISALHKYAHTLDVIGHPYESERALTEAWRLAQQHKGMSPQARLRYTADLARARHRIGRYADAASLRQDARDSGFEPTEADMLSTAALAYDKHDATPGGETDPLALETLQRALEENVASMGTNHWRTARVQIGLASRFNALKRYEDALPHARAALATFHDLFGEDHPDTASCLLTIAEAQFHLGQTQAASDGCERAIAIWHTLSDADHPQLVSALGLLSSVRLQHDQPDLAVTLARQARQMASRIYDGDHHLVAGSLMKLGQALCRAGTASEGLACLDNSYQMQRRLHPGDHPTIVKRLQVLSVANRDLGSSIGRLAYAKGDSNLREASQVHYNKALQIATEAFDMALRIWEPDHPSVQASRMLMARALLRTGQQDDALALTEDTLLALVSIYGEDHRAVADALGLAGTIALVLERPGLAKSYLLRAIEAERSLPNTRADNVAQSMNGLGFAYLQLGEHEQAEDTLKQARDFANKCQPRDLFLMAWTRFALGSLYCELERWDDARSCIQEAIRVGQSAADSKQHLVTSWRRLLMKVDRRSRDKDYEFQLIFGMQ